MMTAFNSLSDDSNIWLALMLALVGYLFSFMVCFSWFWVWPLLFDCILGILDVMLRNSWSIYISCFSRQSLSSHLACRSRHTFMGFISSISLVFRVLQYSSVMLCSSGVPQPPVQSLGAFGWEVDETLILVSLLMLCADQGGAGPVSFPAVSLRTWGHQASRHCVSSWTTSATECGASGDGCPPCPGSAGADSAGRSSYQCLWWARWLLTAFGAGVLPTQVWIRCGSPC